MPRLLPLAAASLELGVPAATLRKRVKAGTVRGERRQTPQGFLWYVEVADEPAASNGHVSGSVNGRTGAIPSGTQTDTHLVDRADDQPVDQMDDQMGDQPGPRTVDRPVEAPPATQRARDMAEYSERLLAPYVRRLEEQAERIGRLEERAEHLEAERDTARADLEHTQAERDAARADLEAARHRAEDASREAEAARRETEETVRLAEEAAGLRAAAEAGARRPWWRFWEGGG
jgi:hypothetical protein